jgi:hypothetical protein
VKKFQTASLVVLVLLSLGAGAAKVMRVPNEVKFFQDVGFGTEVLMVFGAAQILAAILLLIPMTRLLGAIVAGGLMLLSAAMILVNGQPLFAVVSLLPVALAAVVVASQNQKK